MSIKSNTSQKSFQLELPGTGWRNLSQQQTTIHSHKMLITIIVDHLHQYNPCVPSYAFWLTTSPGMCLTLLISPTPHERMHPLWSLNSPSNLPIPWSYAPIFLIADQSSVCSLHPANGKSFSNSVCPAIDLTHLLGKLSCPSVTIETNDGNGSEDGRWHSICSWPRQAKLLTHA